MLLNFNYSIKIISCASVILLLLCSDSQASVDIQEFADDEIVNKNLPVETVHFHDYSKKAKIEAKKHAKLLKREANKKVINKQVSNVISCAVTDIIAGAIMLVLSDDSSIQSIVYVTRVSLVVSLLNMFNAIDLLDALPPYVNSSVYPRLRFMCRVYYIVILFLCALDFILNFSRRMKFYLLMMIKFIVLYVLMVLQIVLKTNRLHLVLKCF